MSEENSGSMLSQARVTENPAPVQDMKIRAAPFFILGCVCSGTTLLRDVLRAHPNLACPEETHFFRWANPFGTVDYARACMDSPVLKKHRAMDAISEEEFKEMLKTVRSRRESTARYMGLLMSSRKPEATRGLSYNR